MSTLSTPLPSAHEAFVVLDPVQDWEESVTILGVYRSLEAAKVATRVIRRRSRGHYHLQPERVTHIEHWAGDVVLGTWEFDPERGAWTPLEER